MKIQCPLCTQIVPSEYINLVTGLVSCPSCDGIFKISESIDLDLMNVDILKNPPSGAWFKEGKGHVVIGSMNRISWGIFMSVVFLCFCAILFYKGFTNEGNPRDISFDSPVDIIMLFLFTGVALWLFFTSLFGKVEINIGENSYIFRGIGPVGRKQHFDWSSVREFYVERIKGEDNFSFENPLIIMHGKDRIKVETGSVKERMQYVINALKFLRFDKQYQSYWENVGGDTQTETQK